MAISLNYPKKFSHILKTLRKYNIQTNKNTYYFTKKYAYLNLEIKGNIFILNPHIFK